jgi:hypothetical protein
VEPRRRSITSSEWQLMHVDFRSCDEGWSSGISRSMSAPTNCVTLQSGVITKSTAPSVAVFFEARSIR